MYENWDVVINNCNSIDNGLISIKKNKLNIKYGINGTGKSTIAKALLYAVEDKANSTRKIEDLKPFKFIGDSDNDPEVTGIDDISTIMIFDEKYINDFVFSPDDLLKGSFDIFIRTEDYERGLENIGLLINEIRTTFAHDEEIDEFISDLTKLSKSFGRQTRTGLHGSSPLAKAFKNGNVIKHIPSGLEDYTDYLQQRGSPKWIKWHLDGKSYLDIADKCPYCVSNIEEKRQTINQVSEVYDAKSVEHLNEILETFSSLKEYFTDATQLKIDEFIGNTEGYTDDQVVFLQEIKTQIDRLTEKLNKTKSIGFSALKDVGRVIEELELYKIDLGLYNHLNSEKTHAKIEDINNSIDTTLTRAGELQRFVNQQNRHIERLVKTYNEKINEFLKNAGYGYKVDLSEDEKGNHKLKLLATDVDHEIVDAKKHLSFGEKNAFSLVLFMYDALKQSPDIVILDDPISSFDKNKKYAIIDMLFRKSDTFKDKSVLLLTHDFDPIIDMMLHHRDRFPLPFATFLENNHNQLTEQEIEKDDIKTFEEINRANVQNSSTNMINRLIYLRRLYEVNDVKGNGYQIISSLLHKRVKPKIKDEGIEREMTPEEIDLGMAEIHGQLQEFNYDELLDIINDDAEMMSIYDSTDNNYEKLHIYRIIFENRDDEIDKIDSKVILKFINEAFHIENNYIYQLDPSKYQMVPQFVIDECNVAISRLCPTQ
ncbi:AAA family ATPase [Methanococcoides sp. FTZ1]|uniref:AAA family ATPase n=1 Tax=Methanococcoides sp. FTZ1 TaxID=3439061 RepID=UPI003F8273B2